VQCGQGMWLGMAVLGVGGAVIDLNESRLCQESLWMIVNRSCRSIDVEVMHGGKANRP
jgi:hypothetical protein